MSAIGSAARGVLRLAIRARYLILALWAVPWAVHLFPRATLASDWWVFEFGARTLANSDPHVHVTGGALHLYEWMPRLQIGPPALIAAMPFEWFPPMVGRVLAVITMILMGLAVLFVLERVARLSGVADSRRRELTLVGGLLFIPAWTVLAAAYMHLDDASVFLLAVVAMHEVLRGRWWTAAIALGLGAATKPWAVALFALLLLLPRIRRAPAFLVAIGVAGVCWLPFVLAAPDTVQAAGSVITVTARDSTWNLLGFVTSPNGARPLQMIAMIAVALLVIRAGRWPGLVFAVVAVRMITDWQTWLYYTTGLVLGALIWDMLRGRSRLPWLTMLSAGLLFVESRISQSEAALPFHSGQHLLAVLRLLVLVPLIVAMAWQGALPVPERFKPRAAVDAHVPVEAAEPVAH